MNILTKLQHLKIRLFGDKELEKQGYKIIKCKKCNTKFKSYLHYGEIGYIHDTLCEVCTESEI